MEPTGKGTSSSGDASSQPDDRSNLPWSSVRPSELDWETVSLQLLGYGGTGAVCLLLAGAATLGITPLTAGVTGTAAFLAGAGIYAVYETDLVNGWAERYRPFWTVVVFWGLFEAGQRASDRVETAPDTDGATLAVWTAGLIVPFVLVGLSRLRAGSRDD